MKEVHSHGRYGHYFSKRLCFLLVGGIKLHIQWRSQSPKKTKIKLKKQRQQNNNKNIFFFCKIPILLIRQLLRSRRLTCHKLLQTQSAVLPDSPQWPPALLNQSFLPLDSISVDLLNFPLQLHGLLGFILFDLWCSVTDPVLCRHSPLERYKAWAEFPFIRPMETWPGQTKATSLNWTRGIATENTEHGWLF